MTNTVAKIRHWFFKTLTPEQRKGFFEAWGFPKGAELSLGMQYHAIDRIAALARQEEDAANAFAVIALAATGRGTLSAEEVEAEKNQLAYNPNDDETVDRIARAIRKAATGILEQGLYPLEKWRDQARAAIAAQQVNHD